MAYLRVLFDKKKTKGKREYNSCNILYWTNDTCQTIRQQKKTIEQNSYNQVNNKKPGRQP